MLIYKVTVNTWRFNIVGKGFAREFVKHGQKTREMHIACNLDEIKDAVKLLLSSEGCQFEIMDVVPISSSLFSRPVK